MQQKLLIIVITTLFILSSGYLFYVSNREMDPDFQKNWWVVYFQEPKGVSLDFTIENHSSRDSFDIDATDGKEKLYSEKGIMLPKGNSHTINLDEKIGKIENGKISITVTDGENKKEIYKNLP